MCKTFTNRGIENGIRYAKVPLSSIAYANRLRNNYSTASGDQPVDANDFLKKLALHGCNTIMKWAKPITPKHIECGSRTMPNKNEQ
jgi:hypothetical protein